MRKIDIRIYKPCNEYLPIGIEITELDFFPSVIISLFGYSNENECNEKKDKG